MSPMLALYVVTAQKQLAMDTGYDPRTIRRVELGECCPSAEFMFEMSDYFGVPIEEIFALINLQNQYREENKFHNTSVSVVPFK